MYGYDVVRVGRKDPKYADVNGQEGFVIGHYPADPSKLFVQLPTEESPRVICSTDLTPLGRKEPLGRKPASAACSRFPWLHGVDADSLADFNAYAIPFSELSVFMRDETLWKSALISIRAQTPARERYERLRFSRHGWWLINEVEPGVTLLGTNVLTAPCVEMASETFGQPDRLALLLLSRHRLEVERFQEIVDALGVGTALNTSLTRSQVRLLHEAELGFVVVCGAHPYQDNVPIILLPRVWEGGALISHAP